MNLEGDKNITQNCPVAMALKIISTKWKILIIRDLLIRDMHFGELHRSLDGISKKVLCEQLRGLESDGLISRNISSGKIKKVKYSLTALGQTLETIMAPLADWWFNHGQFIKQKKEP